MTTKILPLNKPTAEILVTRIEAILPDYAQAVTGSTAIGKRYPSLETEYRKIIDYREDVRRRFDL